MLEKFEPLNIGVTSRALFDLEKEHEIFKNQGYKAYRDHQLTHVDDCLTPGVAFPFISRLLRLNTLFGKTVVRVSVISKNSPETGQRVFNSCRELNLPVHMGAFTSGQPTLGMIDAMKIDLFLSANPDTVNEAIANGKPAGLIMHAQHLPLSDEEEDSPLRIAFDFDGVIADDESERCYQQEGLDGFNAHEQAKAQIPHQPGPLAMLFKKLSFLQNQEVSRLESSTGDLQPAFRIAIVTARGASSCERLMTTLREAYGMRAVELYFLDGLDKLPLLESISPHIFFDDQYCHLKEASGRIPSVLVPFGIHKQQFFA